MEMIIGGAFQGKSAYARREHPQLTWTDGEEADEAVLLSARGVLGFENYIRKELAAGRDVKDLAEKLIAGNPEVVLVSGEVGYGVVPADAFAREYREAVGRICTKLAAHSRKVTRVVCGIGTVIKNA